MKFQINGRVLVKAIREAKKFTGRQHTLPILKSIVIVANKSEGGFNHVRFKASDLETVCDFWQEVNVLEEGTVVVPAKETLAILKSVKRDLIVESGEDDKVVFRSVEPGFSVTVEGTPIEEFPTLLDYEPTREDRVPSASLYRALSSVAHAVSDDESRYNLNGVMVDADTDPTVRCVATDGHRLCVADAGPISLPWSGPIIIPANAVTLLLPLMSKTTEVAMSHFGGSFQTLKISGDGWSVSTRLVEGEFPNYLQVIPKQTTETIQVDRIPFIEALESVLALAPERSHAVKFTINGDILLETNNPDLGYASTRCACDRATGQPELVLGFNGRYIMDALKELHNPKIQLAVKDHDSPIRFTERDESHPLCVVMPMRL